MGNEKLKISVILLAAGLSRRFGSDKLLMEYNGKILLQLALDLLFELPSDERVVVTTEKRIKRVLLRRCVAVCINPNPEDGVSSSVRIGLQNATGTHFLFLNADQPDLTAYDILPMIDLAKRNPENIIYPVVNGEPVSPAIFPKSLREELLALTGDVGGREVRDKHPELCIEYIPEHPERFKDIDNYNQR